MKPAGARARGSVRSRVADLLEAAPVGGLDLEGAVLDVEEASQTLSQVIEDRRGLRVEHNDDVGRHDVHPPDVIVET